MRTYDNKKGEKILHLINQYEPEGIRLRKLWKKSGLSKDGFRLWIRRLTELGLIYKKAENARKVIVRLSDKTRDKMGIDFLVSNLLKPDSRANPRLVSSSKRSKRYIKKVDTSIQFLILSRAAFEDNAYFKVPKNPTAGDFAMYDYRMKKEIWYTADDHRRGFAISDLKKPRSIVTHQSPNEVPNFTNAELLGHLISTKQIRKNTQRLMNHVPPIIEKIDDAIQFDEIRFIITDSLLREFIHKCILMLVPIEQFLSELYVHHKELKILKYKVKEFKRWFVALYGPTSRTRSFFNTLQERKIKSKVHNPNIDQDFAFIRQSAITLNYHFHEILDNEFRNINPKYTRLIHNYGSVIDIENLMSLIAPRFLRDSLRTLNYRMTIIK